MTKPPSVPEATGKKSGKSASKKANQTSFKPGVSGNPAGRPKGSRNKICQKYIEDLHQVWLMAQTKEVPAEMTMGQAAILNVAMDRPTAFLSAVGNLVPKEFDVGDKTSKGFRDLWTALATGKVPTLAPGDQEDGD